VEGMAVAHTTTCQKLLIFVPEKVQRYRVFSLYVGGVPVPLLLIAIMTFVLITSSGTMALAVK